MPLFPKTPTLTSEELAQVSAALTARSATIGAGMKSKLCRVADEKAPRQRFLNHAYVRYLHEGGAKANGDFVKWLLEFITSQQFLTFLQAIIQIVLQLFPK